MLRELIQYWCTPCKPEFRKLGYLKELIAIEARNRRVGGCWLTHRENSKNAIRDAIKGKNYTQNKAIVLGAGLLLDVPISELSETFKEVILVDVVFSRSALKEINRFNNISCVAHDVTGIAELLVKSVGVCELADPKTSLPFEINEDDFIFSINILSQLPIIPVQYVKKHLGCNEKQLEEWSAKIIKNHISWLQSCNAKVLLISDIEHRALNRQGDVEQVFDCIYGQKLPEPFNEWSWEYAPYGELAKDYALKAKVQVFLIE